MTRTPRHLANSLLVLASVLCLAPLAWAGEVGTVAALEGTAEIGRNGTWIPAAIGSPIDRGDELHTFNPGKLRVVFQDDSVLAVSDDSRITVNEQVFNGEKGSAKSFMELLQGKVTAVVSDYYHRAGNSYEIKTVTAVAGVRGTEFAMTFDPQASVTEVVGVSGHIEVHSAADPTGPGVLVTANEATTIEFGKLPTRPRRIEESMFRQRLEGIDFVGRGRPESLTSAQSLSNVPAPDRVGSVSRVNVDVAEAPNNAGNRRDASSLLGKNPQLVLDAGTGKLGISLGHR